ncbi:MAG: four helix bundle protein [Petrimonas sp.]|nr:four helix bundle protein [Petrimonas sp.]
MEQNEWVKYKIEVRERLRAFALKILDLSEIFPEVTRGKVVNYQLTKSGTSVYANYRAALRSRSKAEFFSKMTIVVEEADESEMWLDLIIASGMINTDFVQSLHAESEELLKILVSMRSKL